MGMKLTTLAPTEQQNKKKKLIYQAVLQAGGKTSEEMDAQFI